MLTIMEEDMVPRKRRQKEDTYSPQVQRSAKAGELVLARKRREASSTLAGTRSHGRVAQTQGSVSSCCRDVPGSVVACPSTSHTSRTPHLGK